MKEIRGQALSVRALLKGVKYSIDYYQREFKWQAKQADELLSDLTGKFLEEYEPGHLRSKVADYPHYFLGSVIISKKDSGSYIVDGQQRLTTLTLLLMLLRHLQKDRADQVNVDELIVSERYGQKSFNLHVDERADCMAALYDGMPFDPSGRGESVRNLYQRFLDLDAALPDAIRNGALPYFADWLLENVHLVEITAYSDDDAYTIFETMNDRGLSLSPTDMLKGYLLANIGARTRTTASNRWRDRIRELNQAGKEVEPDFFKAWLRSQHAVSQRKREKGATPEDFDRIGTEFHRWLRDSARHIGLADGEDFYRFIERDFDFYSRQYLRLIAASQRLIPGLEHVLYNAHNRFTLQYMVLLAPIRPDDDQQTVTRKLAITARFLDIVLARRIWNFRSTDYSTMQYAMFSITRDIRGLDSAALAKTLHAELARETETFASNDRLRVHQQNRYAVHRLLARLTDYAETRSGLPSMYLDYVNEGPARYEIEHIWADHAERHADEFSQRDDFAEYRNRIGDLLLLPKSFNASFGDLPYKDKLPHYNAQNLLARSLHPQSYDHNPGFSRFVRDSGLPFQPHAHFRRAELNQRGSLYQQLAERIWNPDDLLIEAGL